MSSVVLSSNVAEYKGRQLQQDGDHVTDYKLKCVEPLNVSLKYLLDVLIVFDKFKDCSDLHAEEKSVGGVLNHSVVLIMKRSEVKLHPPLDTDAHN